jgi:hypothetical protein
MYPHAVQFETRRLELEQWIQLNRDRRQTRTRHPDDRPCSKQPGSKSVHRPAQRYEPARAGTP